MEAAPHAERERLHQPRGLGGGARTDLVGRLGLRRPRGGAPGPGDYIVRDLIGESIFIVRNAAGELHGFYNVCSHRGTKFLDDEPAAGTSARLSCARTTRGPTTWTGVWARRT